MQSKIQNGGAPDEQKTNLRILAFNGRMIYPFNKELRIYEGGTMPFWHAKNVYFYLKYEVETLQVVRLAFLV